MKKRIIVDADSCPVKDEIIQVAKEFSIPVIFVASYAHYMSEIQGAKILYVDSTKESADLFIANYLEEGDHVITGDYGLASMILKPGIHVLSFRGTTYTQKNLDGFLAQRYMSAKVRRGGGKTKGPKPFTNEIRKKFVENLRKSFTD